MHAQRSMLGFSSSGPRSEQDAKLVVMGTNMQDEHQPSPSQVAEVGELPRGELRQDATSTTASSLFSNGCTTNVLLRVPAL